MSMVKILEYTDKIDYPVIAHTQSLKIEELVELITMVTMFTQDLLEN